MQNELTDNLNIPTGKEYKINNVNIQSFNFFETTVGATGAEYTTLGSAVTAGKTRILVINNTTEVANTVLSKNIYVQSVGDKTIDFAGNYLDLGVYNAEFFNLNIDYANNGGFLDGNTSNHILRLRNVTVRNQSNTINNPFLRASSVCTIYMYDCRFDLPNYANNYISTAGRSTPIYIDGLHVSGGGSNCNTGLLSNERVNNLRITGTFSTGSETQIVFNFVDIKNISNVYSTCSGGYMVLKNAVNFEITGTQNIDIRGNAANIDTNSEVIIKGIAPDAIIDNLYAPNAFVGVYSGIATRVLISNSKFQKMLTNSGLAKVNFSNCQFEEGDFRQTVVLDSCLFTDVIEFRDNPSRADNCTFLDDVTVSISNVTISNCNVGDIATGGTTKTITIASGVANTIIDSCRLDDDIVNNGEGSQISYIKF